MRREKADHQCLAPEINSSQRGFAAENEEASAQ
jgi:hypothetical protein